jgi:hypothetical protein
MHRVEQGADAAQIAAAIVSTLQAIDAALSSIIGQGGVAALYRRSLHLSAPTYPWLASPSTSVPAVMDLPALQSVLIQQGSAAAAAGGGFLLHTFYELLASLIGSALTERLLCSVWANAFGNPLPQDPSHDR